MNYLKVHSVIFVREFSAFRAAWGGIIKELELGASAAAITPTTEYSSKSNLINNFFSCVINYQWL